MHPALWVSKTGLTAQNKQLSTISNNLSNVNTNGFKRDRANFQDLLYQTERQPGGLTSQNRELPSGLQLGTGVRVTATTKEHTQGDMKVTEQSLDMAIDGKGFFQVENPDGEIYYTRNGEFQLNDDGDIVTPNGDLLEPNINVPEDATSITIGRDGTVSAVINNEADAQELGQIDLANFVNPRGLEAIGQNLFRETQASGDPIIGEAGIDGLGTIEQGMLEGSNVEIVEEMVDMITTQRAFEMNSNVVSTSDEMLQFINQTLQ